jgi:polyisoprenoid-binding protein YceI
MFQFKMLPLVTLMFFPYAFAAQTPAPGNYALDPMHSKVGFEIAHLVISTVEGSFKTFEGTVTLDKSFTKSKATARIDVSSIDTGVTKRDEHLKSPDFFDAAKFNAISFQSKSFSGTPENFTMTGDLTMKGETHPVTFKGQILGSMKDGYGNQKMALRAETTLSRKAFGLTWNSVVEAGPVVGDEVKVRLNLQAALAK